MKKKNLKALKLNKKSISQLHGNAIRGGEPHDYSYLCTSIDCTFGCTLGCISEQCSYRDPCPSSWIYICAPCETTTVETK